MLEFGGPLVGRGRPDRSSALLADGTPDAIVEPDFLRENELLPKASEDFDSMVFIPDRVRIGKPEFLLRTDALVAALRACGGSAAFWGKLLKLAPRGLRDLGYRLVARYRHRFFSD
ncbi:DCC1-like thiol-disulfide oxidoreductase family protein [Cephaloticoccus primus]|uniref:DCC1-like thiol-disulfide oxidoreductase family protein n=1 Tax=Cephaloticoccus primus TaxID=1548207 RepID=UPI0012E96D82|nr:DCC1-like thiol-disulfide oxidoreductase family protein [Cephaloticoccus primus]